LLPANADCTGADSHGPSTQAIESKLQRLWLATPPRPRLIPWGEDRERNAGGTGGVNEGMLVGLSSALIMVIGAEPLDVG
jgi:hypothetical protein